MVMQMKINKGNLKNSERQHKICFYAGLWCASCKMGNPVNGKWVKVPKELI